VCLAPESSRFHCHQPSTLLTALRGGGGGIKKTIFLEAFPTNMSSMIDPLSRAPRLRGTQNDLLGDVRPSDTEDDQDDGTLRSSLDDASGDDSDDDDPLLRVENFTRLLPPSDYLVWHRHGIVAKRLWAAAEVGDDYEIRALAEHMGADVNVRDRNIYNYTALFWAAMNGHESTVRLLLALGAAPDAQDKLGSTPLFYAADRGWPRIVQVLADAGADVWRKNRMGRYALDWAEDWIAVYDPNRTPEADKQWHPGRVHPQTAAQALPRPAPAARAAPARACLAVRHRAPRAPRRPRLCAQGGSNWDTVWLLRSLMGVPPPDKYHTSGALSQPTHGQRRLCRAEGRTRPPPPPPVQSGHVSSIPPY